MKILNNKIIRKRPLLTKVVGGQLRMFEIRKLGRWQ